MLFGSRVDISSDLVVFLLPVSSFSNSRSDGIDSDGDDDDDDDDDEPAAIVAVVAIVVVVEDEDGSDEQKDGGEEAVEEDILDPIFQVLNSLSRGI